MLSPLVTGRFRNGSAPWSEVLGDSSSDLFTISCRSGRPAGADQAGLVGEDDELGPVPGAELGHRPGGVGLHRGRADVDLAGDLLVGQPEAMRATTSRRGALSSTPRRTPSTERISTSACLLTSLMVTSAV